LIQRCIELIARNRNEPETWEELPGGGCEQVDVAHTLASRQLEGRLGKSLAQSRAALILCYRD